MIRLRTGGWILLLSQSFSLNYPWLTLIDQYQHLSIASMSSIRRLVLTGKSTRATIDFPMKCRAFRFQFSLKPIHWMSSSPHWNHHFPMVFLWFFPHVLQRKKSTISPQPRAAQALEFRRPIRPAWTAASWARAALPKARKRDPPEHSYGSYPLVN